MKKYKLGEVCSIVPGYSFKAQDFGSGENFVVKIKEITPPRIAIEKLERVSFSPNKKYLLQEGDFVMAMTGATIGKVGRLDGTGSGNIYINQRVCKFIPNPGYSKEYLYYLLNTKSFQDFIINNVDNKLAQPNIGHPTIYKYEHVYPSSYYEQQQLIIILSNLDRKIALNRAINHNLPIPDHSLREGEARRVA